MRDQNYYYCVVYLHTNITSVRKVSVTEGILHGGTKIWILFSSGKTVFYERAKRGSNILFLAFYYIGTRVLLENIPNLRQR